jgi:serine/threonine protein kinase
MTHPFDPPTSLDPVSAASATGGGEAFDDPRVVELVQQYQAELEQGRRPVREEYLRRYPELEAVVRECLDGLDLLRGGFPGSQSRSGPGLSPARSRGPEVAPRALGDFLIVREIARGGMGVVYEAVQQSLGRRVALKVLPFAATFDARQLQRFKNEAQAAALLHHTHIVPIYAVGSDRGVHFYAMQLIEGQSLAVVIRQLREQAGLARDKPRHSGGDDSQRGRNVAFSAGNGWAEAAAFPSTEARSPEGAGVALATPPGEGGRGGGRGRADEPGQGADALPAVTGGVPGSVAGSVAGVSTATAGRGAATGPATTGASRSSYFRKTARLMIQAADALDHAHQLGVVHRDIKPGNLMMNAQGDLWVTDFGLAMFQTETGLTRTGDLLGTFRYMSPEQAAGKRAVLDHRTDIYSLGATFYELLTLEPVFAGETRAELLYQILHEDPRPLRGWNKHIPAELEIIVLKALAKNPEERYGSAAELAADVRRFLEHQPILARPPTLFDRVKKWSRRHPGVVTTAVVLLGVMMLGLMASTAVVARAQQRTVAALDGERLRANEAEEQFQRARAAVDVLIEVSEEELVDKPNLEPTRKRLLRTALEYYRQFIEDRPSDSVSQESLAAVQDRIKGLLNDLTVLQRDGQINLLSNPAVAEDLDLSDSQQQKLAELLPRWFGEKIRAYEEVRNAGVTLRRRRFVELAEEHEQVVRELLTGAQRSRLDQLAIQAQGIYAFREPDIVQALQLTSEQRASMRELEFQLMLRSYGRRPMGRGEGEERRRQAEAAIRETMDKALDLLDSEQQSRWVALVGPACEGLGNAPRILPGQRAKPEGGPKRGPGLEPPGEGGFPPPRGGDSSRGVEAEGPRSPRPPSFRDATRGLPPQP